MTTFTCLLVILATSAVVLCKVDNHPLSDDFIQEINQKQSSWQAGRNFDINTPMSYIKGLMGFRSKGLANRLPTKNFRPSALYDLPDSFDSRQQWPACKSLSHITDQSECGSCWAVAATSAMTDRLCIGSNGTVTTPVSAADLMECCSFCGDGCDGGDVGAPWLYWQLHGIASGGDYRSDQGCVNYPFAPCEHHTNGSKPACSGNHPTPKCRQACDSDSLSYASTITKGKSVYSLNSVEQIQAEILENGPVEAGFDVYADFITYKSGVYHRVQGEMLGGHAVRIIGWGVENSTPYWLIANSWNEDWGDKGYFKIRRGQNDCGIESEVFAGQPVVPTV